MASEQQLAERVVVSRDVLHGKPRIAGTRIMGGAGDAEQFS
jgi:uncharacterized protein (DUF433 family)